MKKFLSLISVLCLGSAGTSTIVSCGSGLTGDQLVGKEKFFNAIILDVKSKESFNNYNNTIGDYGMFPNDLTFYVLENTNNPLEHMQVSDGDLKFDNFPSSDSESSKETPFDIIYLFSNESNFNFDITTHNQNEIAQYIKEHIIAVVMTDTTAADFRTYFNP